MHRTNYYAFLLQRQKEERSHRLIQQLFFPTSWHWRWAWKEVTMALSVSSLNEMFFGERWICIETTVALIHSFTYPSKLFCQPIFKSLKWPSFSDTIRIESLLEAGLGLSVIVCVNEVSCCSRKKILKNIENGGHYMFLITFLTPTKKIYFFHNNFLSYFPPNKLILLIVWLNLCCIQNSKFPN